MPPDRLDTCFRIESAAPHGWVVYLDGTRRTHFFVSREIAIAIAKLWAERSTPSRVELVDRSGAIRQDWRFPGAREPGVSAGGTN